MNPNLERAQLLFQQSRYELAEAELRQALASEPHDSYAHALLGMCLSEREQFPEATSETEQAIHLAPDSSFAHYAHARVFYDRNRYAEALRAIQEAIRLNPEDADYHSLLAGIHLAETRWRDALLAAEQGLQFDPEHVGCTNLRAMAMVKLGRKAEAGATIDVALSRNPDNALTHANQGWTLLEKGEPKKALEHFKEALRLDPENEWARQGIVEALKARNIIYALMLKYFLWMSHFSRRGQWGIVLGAYFGNRILGAIASGSPALAPWILPIRICYLVFALMTWMAYPFFNLLLRVNRFGRLVLSREQTVASNWFGLCLLLALLGLAGFFITGLEAGLVAAAAFGLLLFPVCAVWRCSPGWSRKGMTVAAILLGCAAVIAVICVGAASVGRNRNLADFGRSSLVFVAVGSIASMWVTNFLSGRRTQR